jgi:RecA-family ATPase
MGADTSKIIALQGMRRKDEENRQYVDSFNLKTDLEALEQAVRSKNDVKLVIIDPLSAYLGGKVDAYRDTDVRGVLMPLVQFAEKNNVAVIGVRHLNKSGTGKAIYRGLDSIAFTAAARTVWLLSTDPTDPDSKRRLLTAAKHNLLIEPSGLAFELNGGRVIFEDEPVTLTSDEALGQTSTVEAVVKDEAVLWLRDTLTPGKSLASTELDKLAETQGIKSSTLRRAKKEASVTSYRLQVGDKTQWFCRIGE